MEACNGVLDKKTYSYNNFISNNSVSNNNISYLCT
jgi:hypothetical protein